MAAGILVVIEDYFSVKVTHVKERSEGSLSDR